MPIQLPTEVANCFPLLLSFGMLVACIGLTCNLAGLVVRKAGNSLVERTNWSNKLLRLLSAAWLFASATLWLVVTALHLMGWQLCLVEASRSDLHLMSYVASFTAILLGWQLWKRIEDARFATASRVVLQAVQVGVLLGCLHLFPVSQDDTYPQMPPGNLVARQVAAQTDAGTRIELFDRQTTPSELSKFFQATQAHITNVSKHAMFRCEPEPELNCHGWVFSGQHIIKCEDVPTILKDNGYQIIAEPKAGDLVVYTNQMGTVVHTGVVCGFLADETVLVESKWGVAGRYIHFVDEQPYSPSYRFYRSPRDGHRLRYCDASPADLAGKCDSGASSESSVPNGVELSSAGSSFFATQFFVR